MREHRSVYLLGIGGIAMANVAVLLRSAGFNVCGSDQSIYEPAASILRRADIEVKTPYSVSNLPDDENTTIIVGNVQSRGQIEVEEALRRNLKLESFPGFIRRTLMAGKQRIVIAGTHGKSTTTACVAFLLSDIGRAPSFLIGADPVNLPYGGQSGTGSEFVIEGDEYDSAFFDKRSKFLDYFPHILILGRVEHDHLDIFPTVEEMLLSYRRLIAQLPSNGTLVVAADSVLAVELAQHSPCKVITVSDDTSSDYYIENENLRTPSGQVWLDFAPGMIGKHNLLNVAMAIAGIATLEVSLQEIFAAAKSFRGIKRRMELLFESSTLLVYDDFAHHPTAIVAAIEALKQKHPDHQVVAVFEPRSNTAVRNKYQNDFRTALAHAREVVIGTIHRKEKISQSDVLDTQRMVSELKLQNVQAVAIENDDIASHLLEHTRQAPCVVLFMSNGGFGGAPAKFVKALQENKITA